VNDESQGVHGKRWGNVAEPVDGSKKVQTNEDVNVNHLKDEYSKAITH